MIDDRTVEYFEKMRCVMDKHVQKINDIRTERKKLMEAGKKDEAGKLYGEEFAIDAPYSNGKLNAYNAWRISEEAESCVKDSRVIDVQDLSSDGISAEDLNDFVLCMSEAGVKRFSITDTSHSLMEILHWLVDSGWCSIEGLCKVKRKDSYSRVMDDVREYNGIMIKMNY